MNPHTEQSDQGKDLPLPEPGIKKSNPKELDKELDQALEDSMDASDPPAAVQPEVKIKDEH